MKIDAFLTPYFPETESFFDNSIVIMIDVLRASTTVCTALHNGAKEVIATENLDKAVSVYNNLSREVRFLGGERNGKMPAGFDAGNSPSEYTPEKMENKTVIICTTNGTKIFQKAKQSLYRIIAGFANHTSICNFLIEKSKENPEAKFVFLCAGTNGRLSYEDTLCAGSLINKLSEKIENIELTDTSYVTKNLYKLHSENLKEFLSNCEHSNYLKSIGFESDLDICLDYDTYPVVPLISGSSIKLYDESL